jgi:hypothetical protein
MQKETKIKIVKIILGVIAAGGILTVAAVAPNALKMVDLFYGKEKRKYDIYKKRYYIKSSLVRLKERGLIEFQKRNNKSFVCLTEKGQKKLLKYQLREKVIRKPRKWDKKWRVVIFDIKEQARNLREGLRQELSNLGFVKLQNSVWVHPYECEEIIGMIKAYFEIGKDVLYMVVEKIENDGWLKEEFGLI